MDNKYSNYSFSSNKENMNTGYTNKVNSGSNNNNNKNKKTGGRYEGAPTLAILAVIVVIIIVLIVCIIKAASKENDATSTTDSSVSSSANISSSESTLATTIAKDPATVEDWNKNFISKSFKNEGIHMGNLILVNYAYEYKFPSNIDIIMSDMNNLLPIKSLYGANGHNTTYVLGSDTQLASGLIDIVNEMFSKMLNDIPDAFLNTKEDGVDRILIASGYRDKNKQESIYQSNVNEYGAEYASLYVAKPGHSEHHTGLTIDVNIFTPLKHTADFNKAQLAWMLENAPKYGFVLRYDDSKLSITKIAQEDWHFRFVGVPHASYMTQYNLCLEEYTDFIKNYTYDNPLNYSCDGNDYIIYYTPANTDDTVTFINVPQNEKDYSISGNNVDGFVVTISK